MFKNLSKQTVEFIMKGYEGLVLSFDDFLTKDILIKTDMVMDACYPSWGGDILIKTDMVMDACYPSWGGYPDLKDQKEIIRLIKLCK